MKGKKEFYIGWQEQMPTENRAFIKRFVILLFVTLPLLVLAVVLWQRPFNEHQFEFGNIKRITGIYFETPVPLLIADDGILSDTMSRNILLVGYGKMGAEGIMREIEGQSGDLNGKRLTLAGTLIYGDGKVLMELTDEEASLIEILDHETQDPPNFLRGPGAFLHGEILDPKCYFGVMKPGEGKIHKSCAIRCISGGIPPVFRHETGDQNSPFKYYLMLDENGNKVNQEVLPHVAVKMNIQGNSSRFLDWDIIYVDATQW